MDGDDVDDDGCDGLPGIDGDEGLDGDDEGLDGGVGMLGVGICTDGVAQAASSRLQLAARTGRNKLCIGFIVGSTLACVDGISDRGGLLSLSRDS